MTPLSKTIFVILLIGAMVTFCGPMHHAVAASCAGPDIPAMRVPAAAGASTSSPAAGQGTPSAVRVEIRRDSGGYRLYRGDKPYFIKGVGGHRAIATARALGANSLRTWGAHNAGAMLEKADSCGMSVLLGIWLSHRASDYLDASYKARKSSELRQLVDTYRNHRALLMWALGNEVNLGGADTPEAWLFVDELAGLIKRMDPDHPVISVIAVNPETLSRIARFATRLDAVGVNAYGALPELRSVIDQSAYTGPYLVTEWGVTGHWEAERTDWNRPIEPPSAVKAAMIHRFYVRDILANRDRCLGSYVFLWGQKQERTPTWYSLIIENLPGFEGQRLFGSAVDMMSYNWRGIWPPNRAPDVSSLTIDGNRATDSVVLGPGRESNAAATARDPESAPLTYIWEILAEPAVTGFGGADEKRPPTIGRVRHSSVPFLQFRTPETVGVYRLFVYAVDGQGRFGTANIPFRVAELQAGRQPPKPAR